MKIEYIKMRWGTGDNYSYVITDDKTKDSWIIDPAEPDSVLPVLKKMDINLKAIVNTHHHYDHSDGNKKLSVVFQGLPIIAGKDSPLVSYTPSQGEIIQLGTDIEIKALHTPCHTQDSICYFAHDKSTDTKLVFTGDTLFTSGCGRFFEGNGAEMDLALNQVLGSLPDDTVVYPGHEYTKSNVKFSLQVMPSNLLLLALKEYAFSHEITTGLYTIKDEKDFNPFMRLSDPDVLKYTGKSDPTAVMDQLRSAKNKL